MRRLLLLLAAAVSGVAATAAEAGRGGASVAVTVSPQVVVYGGRVTVSGTVSTQTAGETVQVLAQACGQTAASPVASTTTTTGGAFTQQVQPLLNTVYSARMRNATSNTVAVRVRPHVRLVRVAFRRFAVRVSAATTFAGKYGLFQRYSGVTRRWVTVRRVVLRANTTGVAPTVVSSAAFRARVARRLRVRFVLPQAQVGACYLAGFSNVVRS